jgi:hypothetical protein
VMTRPESLVTRRTASNAASLTRQSRSSVGSGIGRKMQSSTLGHNYKDS